jgi:hypothetical protein
MGERERRAHASVRRYESAAEADRDDLAFSMQMPETDRILHVWRLSQQMWRLCGDMTDESGLCRSVARVPRR